MIERIKKMEELFDSAQQAVEQMATALDRYAASQENIATLIKYYEGDEWKEDYAEDEAGRLPANLKRGILSEDGIWNLMVDIRELNDNLISLAKSIGKSRTKKQE